MSVHRDRFVSKGHRSQTCHPQTSNHHPLTRRSFKRVTLKILPLPLVTFFTFDAVNLSAHCSSTSLSADHLPITTLTLVCLFIQRCSLVVLSCKSGNFQIVYYYRLQIQVSLYFPFPTNPLNQEIQVFSLGIHMADYPEISFEYLQDQNRPSCCFQLKQKQNIWCL